MKTVTVYPKHNEEKLVRRFLWLPITFTYNGGEETRWLEFATIRYVYQSRLIEPGYWIPQEFVDEPVVEVTK